MNEPNENGFGWEPYVWRGAHGAAMGNLLVVVLGAIYVSLRYGDDTVRYLVVIGGVLGLVAGIISGSAIGFVIFQVTLKLRKQPNIVLRTVIGSVWLLGYSLVGGLTSSRSAPVVFTLVYAILVGGLAGLMARAKTIE